MKSTTLGILLASATLALGGCGTVFKGRSQVPVSPIGGFGTRMGSPDTISPQPADVIALDLPNLILKHVPGSATGDPALPLESALATFEASTLTDTERSAKRNAIIGAVLMASDKNCDVYLEYLHGNQILLKGMSSVISTLASGAGAITTPARSASTLSAIGSAATGVGGNLNEAFFANKTAEVIASGIRADRATLRTNIDARMRNAAGASYASWPLSVALADAVTYHGRCNAISGLGFLQGESELARKTAEKERVASPQPPGATTGGATPQPAGPVAAATTPKT